MYTKVIWVIAAVLGILLISACSTGGKLGKQSNQELMQKYQVCSESEPTGTYAITCGNIVKECKRRKGNDNNACRL